MKLYGTLGNPLNTYHGSGAVILAESKDHAREQLLPALVQEKYYESLDELREYASNGSRDSREFYGERLDYIEKVCAAIPLVEIRLDLAGVVLLYSDDC